jgi:GMP synthase (glutamine-hydrolysing)
MVDQTPQAYRAIPAEFGADRGTLQAVLWRDRNAEGTMKSLIAIRHVHFEDLGVFSDAFAQAGYDIAYREAGVNDLAAIDLLECDMLVVLGAPIGAYEEENYPFLNDELRLLRNRLATKRPALGICLGAQLLARALGASVHSGTAKEIGWQPVALTDEGRAGPLKHLDNVPVLHWHGDTFSLPEGASRLASTPITANQAFLFGTSALGLQFHPEIAPDGFERWLIGHALEIAMTPGVSIGALRRDTARYAAHASRQGRYVLKDWLAMLELSP